MKQETGEGWGWSEGWARSGRTLGVMAEGRESLVRQGTEAGSRGALAGEAKAENGLWPAAHLQ